jgi:hypothetical protein
VSDISTKIGNEDLVWLALNDLKKQKLVEHELPTPVKFDGMNRRQVIKNIGLSSVLAIPVIAALAAPAMAQASICGKMCGNPTACGGAAQPCMNCVAGNCAP